MFLRKCDKICDKTYDPPNMTQLILKNVRNIPTDERGGHTVAQITLKISVLSVGKKLRLLMLLWLILSKLAILKQLYLCIRVK